MERNTSAAPVNKEEKECGRQDEKQDEKPDVKPGVKPAVKQTVKGKPCLGNSKLKLDESIKNDLKLKAEVKVNVKKGSCHKKEDVALMVAESNADQAEKNRKKVCFILFL